MEEKEPKHRNDLNGDYGLKNGGVTVVSVSFDTREEAEAWGNWNNFGEGNPYEITKLYPSVKSPTEKYNKNHGRKL